MPWIGIMMEQPIRFVSDLRVQEVAVMEMVLCIGLLARIRVVEWVQMGGGK